MEASVLSAKALYLAGALDAAQRKAQDILRTNPEEHSVHLLICSIYAHQVNVCLCDVRPVQSQKNRWPGR